MTNPLRIFVLGGHGRVALEFTKQAVAAGHQVFSLLRNSDHSKDLPESSGSGGSATPIVSSLEESTASQLSDLFVANKVDTIVFAAGAGGKGGPERTVKVDQEGAIKTFDAVQKAQSSLENFKRFLLISAVDVRDLNKKPHWYKDEDLERSTKAREAIGKYYEAKYQADLNLHQRTEKGELTFPWFVLRPSTLKDDGPTGKVALGEQKGIATPIPREDVATTLLRLAELEKGQGDGLALDVTGGEVEIKEAVSQAVKRNRTDWVG